MNHHTSNRHHLHVNRQQLLFFGGVVIIALVLLIGYWGIMTGKINIGASQTVVTAQAGPLVVDVSLSSPALKFSYLQPSNKTWVTPSINGNPLSYVTIRPFPLAFSLQCDSGCAQVPTNTTASTLKIVDAKSGATISTDNLTGSAPTGGSRSADVASKISLADARAVDAAVAAGDKVNLLLRTPGYLQQAYCNIATPLPASLSFSTPAAAGDLLGHGTVNALDLNVIVPHLGQSASAAGQVYDYNHDGTINALDLNVMIPNLGKNAQVCQ